MKRLIVVWLAFVWASSAQEITTIAGSGEAGFSETQINNPFGVIVGPDGDTYFCDTGNHVIRRISRKSGKMETIVGTGKSGYSGDGGPPLEAQLFEPYEIRFAPNGDMVWVEMRNHLVRKLDARKNVVETIAGQPKTGFSGDGGPAKNALLNRPHSIVFDKAGDLLICDIGNHRIRRVDMETGTIDTWCGNGEKKQTPDGAEVSKETSLFGPRALAIDRAGDLWLALREGNRIYKITDGKLKHVAGTGKKGFEGNGGPALKATLSGPKGVAISPNGKMIYLADTESHSVRAINLAKSPPTLELIAGTGKKGNGGNGDPLACAMARLHGVGVDPITGDLWIGDSEAHSVRKVSFPKINTPVTLENYTKREVTMSDGSAAFIVGPKTPAANRPWLWRTRFFGAFPSVDLAMLERGWSIAYVDVSGEFGGPKAMKRYDEFYAKVVAGFKLSPKPIMEGFSRGGLPAVNWAAANPEKVAGIYLDAPVMSLHSWPSPKSKLYLQALAAYGLTMEQASDWRGPLDRLKPLAEAKVPIFLVCGGADDVVPFEDNSALLEAAYQKLGGRISVYVKAACGHHPHSLHDPSLVVDWLLENH